MGIRTAMGDKENDCSDNWGRNIALIIGRERNAF